MGITLFSKNYIKTTKVGTLILVYVTKFMHRSLAKDNLQNTSKLYVNQIVRRFYRCSKNNKMQIKFIKVVPFKFFV